MSQPESVDLYNPLPWTTKRLRFEEWETFVRETCPQQHGLVWNLKKTYPTGAWASRNEKYQPDMATYGIAMDEHFHRRRFRGDCMLLWKFVFECHRSGKKRTHNTTRVKGGTSGRERTLQKASKKIGCKASLKVEYLGHDPDHVYLSLSNSHNHEVGGIEDLRFLPLSNEARSSLIERLNNNGDGHSGIRHGSQENQGGDVETTDTVNPTIRIGQLLSYYNIGRMTKQERERRKREISAESIPLPTLQNMVRCSDDIRDSNAVIHVASFTQDEATYDVTFRDGVMASCSCDDYTSRHMPCEHMFAAKRARKSLGIKVPQNSAPSENTERSAEIQPDITGDEEGPPAPPGDGAQLVPYRPTETLEHILSEIGNDPDLRGILRNYLEQASTAIKLAKANKAPNSASGFRWSPQHG